MEMKKIIMTICASENSFGAYSENYEGIWAAGDTVEECKEDVSKAIELIKENLPEDQWPEALKGEYEIEWRYDTESFMYYYGSLMSLSGMERITGINQKQLWAYMHGRRKPRQVQRERIIKAMHNFAKELSEATLL